MWELKRPCYTTDAIQVIASQYFKLIETISGQGSTLGINDMSLPQGGLFDICGTWNPFDICPPITGTKPPGGHQLHRTGTSVDIDLTACVDPNLQGSCGRTITVNKIKDIQPLCESQKGFLVKEPSIHCELPR